jgi:hypothetical protein
MGSIKWREISCSPDRLLIPQEGLYSKELLVREVTTKGESRKQVRRLYYRLNERRNSTSTDDRMID